MRRLLALLLIILTPSVVKATEYQQCQTSATCTIGEFLYDDSYSPLPSQTCTLNAKDPSGTAFITNQAMTSRSDGWYSYDATIGTIEGLYTATICCTPASGTVCLDKSFEVKAASGSSLTPAAIWNYSDRTLTSYGSLVSDIWNYSSRSLTSFGSLVSDIWGYSGRTMTSFGDLVGNIWGAAPAGTVATGVTGSGAPATLAGIVAEQKTQRELLEKLVNAPIISLSLEDGSSIPDLESKLDDSKKQASLLYDAISTSKSRLMTLDSKWNRLTAEAATKEITAVATLIQDQSSLTALSKAWDTESVETLTQESAELKTTLASLLSSTTISKSALAPSSLTASLEHLSNMESVLGDSTSSSGDKTFYGYLAEVEERDASLQNENKKISAVLEDLNGQGSNSLSSQIDGIKKRLLTLNQYPGGESLVTPAKDSSDQKVNFKNILFSLQALSGLNRQILAMNVGDPVRSLWLEEGSIIFRAVITNPSSIISQSVPLKFYLPREVKTDDIIELDNSLSTTYDSSEEALFASGTYELGPKQTKVVFVEVEDIWQLSDAELETLRNQASTLLKPLEKTAYFSQGTTLKSDIDVTLDKVMLSTGKAVTPENKIRAYREAKLELAKVTANMNRLEDLVAQASGTGSIFGFVGGVQTVAVWGIIIVIIAGFVFLSIYFKKLNLAQSKNKDIAETVETETESHDTTTKLSKLEVESPASLVAGNKWQMPAIIAIVVVITSVSTVLLTRLTQSKDNMINQITPTPLASPSATPTPSPSEKPVRNDINVKSEKSVLGESSESSSKYLLEVPEDSSVNIRNNPSSDADIVMAIKKSQDIYVFKVDGIWTQIGFTEADLTKGYWVSSKFIVEK